MLVTLFAIIANEFSLVLHFKEEHDCMEGASIFQSVYQRNTVCVDVEYFVIINCIK